MMIRYIMVLLVCLLDAGFLTAQNPGGSPKEKELTWSPDDRPGDMPSLGKYMFGDKKKKNKDDEFSLNPNRLSKDDQALYEKLQGLSDRYALNKNEIIAVTTIENGFPASKRDYRAYKRAKRKQARFEEKRKKLLRKHFMNQQEEQTRKNMKETQRRAKRFKRTGSYLPLHKRIWFKLTGKYY